MNAQLEGESEEEIEEESQEGIEEGGEGIEEGGEGIEEGGGVVPQGIEGGAQSANVQLFEPEVVETKKG